MTAYVLVVDDDPTVSEVVVRYLSIAGMLARRVGDGLAALDTIDRELPDLVVLDLMLPGLDGLEVCRRLRVRHPDLPVVMLTARGQEADRVLGLELGADDYVTKPFSPRELALRVEAILRRSRAAPPATTLSDGGLVVDTGARRAVLHGADLALTTREFDLLAFLLAHPGRAFGRDELMTSVWGWDVGDRSTVTVHVRRLREKVEDDPSRPLRLVTVWGVGYRYDPQEAATALDGERDAP